MSEPEILPVKPGDWVASRYDAGRVAKVRQVYRYQDEVLVDLILFSRTGEKIGRESEPLGGMLTFEPACPYRDWQRIQQPEFPISLRWVPNPDGIGTAGYHHNGSVLPDRAWTRPIRKGLGGGGRAGNFNPEMEAAALRRAAQELRDAASAPQRQSLLDRAASLERQAGTILKPL